MPTPPKQPRTTLKPTACKSSSPSPSCAYEDIEDVIKANITDPLEIIKIICENKNLGFLYMTPAVPRSSVEYDAFNLKWVTFFQAVYLVYASKLIVQDYNEYQAVFDVYSTSTFYYLLIAL